MEDILKNEVKHTKYSALENISDYQLGTHVLL